MSTRSVERIRRTRWSRTLPAATALAALLFGSAALAQLPDVLSEIECPGCAAFLAHPLQPSAAGQAGAHARAPGVAQLPLLAGTWSSALTSSDDPAWALEDFFCFAACTPAARTTATALLNDPANAHRPAFELFSQVVAANAGHAASLLTSGAHTKAAGVPDTSATPPAVRAPKFACDPHGFASQVVSPLPLSIEQQPDRVVLHYEEFGAERTVLLDTHGDAPASASTSFGVAVGRYENRSLVVETSHIPAGRFYDWFGGGPHSDQLRAVERYTTSDDGDWLFLALELVDPETLGEPLTLTKRWRRVPHAKILRYGCDVMSGQLEGVLAEYFDPAKLEERRRK
jgi:hypothetical protein